MGKIDSRTFINCLRDITSSDLMVKDRTKTGIKGFDELIEGGFPRGSTILLTGTPGTGKTIFSLEYLYNGVTEFKEKGLYVSFGQPVESLKEQALQFGWDLEPLINEGMLEIKHMPIKNLDFAALDELINNVSENKIKRLVVDSISSLAINAPVYNYVKDMALVDIMKKNSFFSPPIMGDLIVKRFIYNFVDSLRLMENDCTTLLISESAERGRYISRDTISEFVADGILLINFESMGGQFSRNLLIRKMRNTINNEDVHPVEISKTGMIIHDIGK